MTLDAHEAHAAAYARALAEVEAEDAAADRSPEAMAALITEQRAANARAEARALLSAGMTPARVTEVLSDSADEPLTEADCTVDPDASERFRELRHMVFTAQANARACGGCPLHRLRALHDRPAWRLRALHGMPDPRSRPRGT